MRVHNRCDDRIARVSVLDGYALTKLFLHAFADYLGVGRVLCIGLRGEGVRLGVVAAFEFVEGVLMPFFYAYKVGGPPEQVPRDRCSQEDERGAEERLAAEDREALEDELLDAGFY